ALNGYLLATGARPLRYMPVGERGRLGDGGEEASNPQSRLSAPRSFETAPDPATTTGPVARAGFDDPQRQVYLVPSQAGPGNDIHAGSRGLQKAPTWGPASLVAIRALTSL